MLISISQSDHSKCEVSILFSILIVVYDINIAIQSFFSLDTCPQHNLNISHVHLMIWKWVRVINSRGSAGEQMHFKSFALALLDENRKTREASAIDSTV